MTARPDNKTKTKTTIHQLSKTLGNLLEAQERAWSAKKADPIMPWMMTTTTSEEDEVAARAIQVSHLAREVIKVSAAIIAISEGKTVEDAGNFDYLIS